MGLHRGLEVGDVGQEIRIALGGHGPGAARAWELGSSAFPGDAIEEARKQRQIPGRVPFAVAR